MELYPGFALYRGLYEFAQFALNGNSWGADGMRWQDLSVSTNGMKEVLIIMSVEWIVVLFVAYYIDQVFSSGSGKSPLFFLKGFQKKPTIQRQRSKVLAQMEKPDVIQEVNFTCVECMYAYYMFIYWIKRIRKTIVCQEVHFTYLF